MKKTNLVASGALAAALLASFAPTAAQATYYGHNQKPITVYFTRHAEKKTSTTSLGPATSAYELVYEGDDATASMTNQTVLDKARNRDDVCGEDKCAEELNAFGLVRADLLATWFKRHGITRRLDTVISSHKRRTFQTVDPTAVEAGLTVLQLPLLSDGPGSAPASELQPESTTPSECPTIAAILASKPGDTVLVAGHSGTLYDIMGDGNDECDGLGLDTSNEHRFPVDAKGKVRDFGDIWKVVIYPNGQARFAYRVNLQPKKLFVDDYAY